MTYPATQTIWLEPTDMVTLGLRRYTRGSSEFTCEGGYHAALNITAWGRAYRDSQGFVKAADKVDHADPRWPTLCEKGCGYPFTDDDAWQEWSELLYQRSDNNEWVTLSQAPPGSMWNASWMPSKRTDGMYLMVRCPNGRDWAVDSEASNCTRKGEPHECWVRHGDPRDCRVTVDKNGNTCAAGAGSILSGDYHGFLQNGVLTAG